jgi:hypothetical protein
MMSFVTQVQSTQDAKACFNAAIAKISNNQDANAKPLLQQEKQKLQQLSVQLKFTKEIGKIFPAPKGSSNATDTQFSARTLSKSFITAISTEINDLRSQISTLDNTLIVPQIHSVALASSVYAPEVSVNKRPFLPWVFDWRWGVFGTIVDGRVAGGARDSAADARGLVQGLLISRAKSILISTTILVVAQMQELSPYFLAFKVRT